MQKLVSIIVVIYKVEGFLRKCLDSLASQTYRNIEVIMSVSDGGDRCVEICDEYARNDYRFIKVETKPQGIAKARNAGLKVIRGEFLAWVDGDDWVERTFVETLVKAISIDGCQMAVCGFYKNYTNKEERIFADFRNKTQISVKDIYKEILSYKSFGMEIWDKLYDVDTIRAIEFPKVAEAEDRFWLREVLEKVSVCAYTGTVEYHYRIRGDSCSRTDDNAGVSMEADQILAKQIIKRYPELKNLVALFLFIGEYRTLYEIVRRKENFDFQKYKDLYLEIKKNSKAALKVCNRREDRIKMRLSSIGYRILIRFIILSQKRRKHDYHKNTF